MANKSLLLIILTFPVVLLSDSLLTSLPYLSRISWILIWIFFIAITRSIEDSLLITVITGLIMEFNRLAPTGSLLASLGLFWVCATFGLKYFFSQMTLLGASLLFVAGGAVYYIAYYLYLKVFSAICSAYLIIEFNNKVVLDNIFNLLFSLAVMIACYLVLSKFFRLFNFSRIETKF